MISWCSLCHGFVSFVLNVLFIEVPFTRPTLCRVIRALAGGVAAGVFGMGAVVLGNALEVWRVPISWTPVLLTLFYPGLSISVSPIYLATTVLVRDSVA